MENLKEMNPKMLTLHQKIKRVWFRINKKVKHIEYRRENRAKQIKQSLEWQGGDVGLTKESEGLWAGLGFSWDWSGLLLPGDGPFDLVHPWALELWRGEDRAVLWWN